jgi:hypothetical protein
MRPAVAALLLVLISATGIAPAVADTDREQTVPVLAYYYLWYDQSSWNRAKVDYPSIGRYSSDDADVMRQQVREAKSAGITGFVVSWKSTPVNDRRLAALADVARAEDFSLSIIYEALDFQRNPLPVEQVREDLTRFAQRYANDPLFTAFDRPAVIWSGTWRFSHDDIASVSAAVRDKLLLLGSEKSVADYERIADVVDGDAYYWSSVDPQRDAGAAAKLASMGRAVHAHHGLWIAPFAPGFDARQIGGNRVVDRRDGQTLRQEHSAAEASSPDVLGLISWNEFSENSYVEPSVNYGDRYLGVLRDIISAKTPGLSPLAADSSDGAAGGVPWGIIAAAGIVVVLLGSGTAVWLLRRRKGNGNPRRRRVVLLVLTGAVIGSAVAGVVVAVDTAQPSGAAGLPTPPASPTTEFYVGAKPVRSVDAVTVVAAGDISCPPDTGGFSEDEMGQERPCQQLLTANLASSLNPDAVLVLGDNQYPNGSLDRYQRGYDATWGRFKAITYPVPGNHEYGTPDAAGYFGYFGAVAGQQGAGYYSYDLAGWHIVALNSECDRIGGCGAGSPQERWLKNDLAAHPAACTLAYWHRPRFSSGTHGNEAAYDAFWQDLYAGGADVVLDGHDHDYERFAPMRPDGTADPVKGIREFVTGTGGDSQYRFHAVVPGSEIRIEHVYGVLDLTLRPGAYDWRFVPEPGAQSTDSGSATCHP